MLKSAGRALGLLIAKSKAYCGLPISAFKKLYENKVLPVIHYGSSICGSVEHKSINAIHNKACRYFLGVKVSMQFITKLVDIFLG